MLSNAVLYKGPDAPSLQDNENVILKKDNIHVQVGEHGSAVTGDGSLFITSKLSCMTLAILARSVDIDLKYHVFFAFIF